MAQTKQPKTFTPRAIKGMAHEVKMRRPFYIKWPTETLYVDRGGTVWELGNITRGHIRKILPEVFENDRRKRLR